MTEPDIVSYLSTFGKKVDSSRASTRCRIKTIQQIENTVNERPGVYWIETNMPLEVLELATEKKRRLKKPEGKGFTSVVRGFQVVYSGTQENIQKRLLEHLFGKVYEGTGCLNCDLNEDPFKGFSWYISFHYINDVSVRYAVESWWRINVGWPPMCKR